MNIFNLIIFITLDNVYQENRKKYNVFQNVYQPNHKKYNVFQNVYQENQWKNNVFSIAVPGAQQKRCQETDELFKSATSLLFDKWALNILWFISQSLATNSPNN